MQNDVGAPEILTGDLDDTWMRRFLTAPRVAVDTETSGLDWSKDYLHLVQLSTPGVGTVLLRRDDLPMPRLGEVLSSPSTVKIFHFAPFDLRFLSQVHSGTVMNVRCTKAASKMLNPKALGSAHSLASLLRQHMGVSLDKGAVRVSDWGTANLSADQITYAVRDVLHLVGLYERLSGLVDQAELTDVYNAICRYLPVDAHLETSGFPNPLVY